MGCLNALNLQTIWPKKELQFKRRGILSDSRYDNDGFDGQASIFDGPLLEPEHKHQPLQKSGACNPENPEYPSVFGYRSVVCRYLQRILIVGSIVC